jgi:L-arabinonolactonase
VTTIRRVGDVSLVWGESLRWDDRHDRLYFVDCAKQTLHWLEGAEPPLHTMPMPSTPTGLILSEDGRLVVALDGGLHVVDVETERVDMLSPYPSDLGERANDAAADLDGNIVTGTLNLVPGPGSYWWYSARHGWRLLDDGIGNANGPAVLRTTGAQTLVFADSIASVLYAYDYDGRNGRVSNRRIFGDPRQLGGWPDGACCDDAGGVWSCVLGAGRLVRYTAAGTDVILDPGVELPADAAFGGANLDRLFVVSIAVDLGDVHVTSANAGALLVLDDTGFRGRPEPRVCL